MTSSDDFVLQYARAARKGETLTRCQGGCKQAYPGEILTPLYIDGSHVPDVCGICALERIRRAHGVEQHSFRANSLAEAYRLAAVAWREHNP